MSVSRHATARQLEDKTVALPLIGAARPIQQTVNSVDGTWMVEALARAIDATTSRKAAGFAMEIDKGQLSKQLQGEGHLSMLRAGRLDRETLLAFAEEIRKHCGVSDDPREEAKADAEQMARLIVRMLARVR